MTVDQVGRTSTLLAELAVDAVVAAVDVVECPEAWVSLSRLRTMWLTPQRLFAELVLDAPEPGAEPVVDLLA